MTISNTDFNFIQQLIYDKSAIVLNDNKKYLVECRLQPLACKEGMAINDLLVRLRTRSFKHLQPAVVDAMTTNETFFFRDIHPFEALKDILREYATASVNDLNIWCAACSSGQEPYTIAMLIKENFPLFPNWSILATDISDKMLERTSKGCYSQIEISRGLPASFLVKYFRQKHKTWEIKNDIRQMVTVRSKES